MIIEHYDLVKLGVCSKRRNIFRKLFKGNCKLSISNCRKYLGYYTDQHDRAFEWYVITNWLWNTLSLPMKARLSDYLGVELMYYGRNYINSIDPPRRAKAFYQIFYRILEIS